jgi:hypothetical protein
VSFPRALREPLIEKVPLRSTLSVQRNLQWTALALQHSPKIARDRHGDRVEISVQVPPTDFAAHHSFLCFAESFICFEKIVNLIPPGNNPGPNFVLYN